MDSIHNEEKKLLKKIARKAGVTIRNYEMVAAGDHILVGVSGGKDSMILLEVLSERRAALPFDFRLSAAHVTLENAGYHIDLSKLEKFCSNLDIELVTIQDQLQMTEGKSPCYHCSSTRRKLLFDKAKELGCNKLAMGHHRYDALETLLINMIYHGSISSLPGKLNMFDGQLQLIRPFIEMDEHLLKAYADIRKYEVEKSGCHFEQQNQRPQIRNLITSIERLHGKGAYNMFHSMSKIFPEYLP